MHHRVTQTKGLGEDLKVSQTVGTQRWNFGRILNNAFFLDVWNILWEISLPFMESFITNEAKTDEGEGKHYKFKKSSKGHEC